MKTKSAVRLAIALVLFFAPVLGRAQAPGIITYQGRITNNGANFTGNGEFRFLVYRSGTPPASLWSHDSSSLSGSMPGSAVSLPVTNGLFSVGLGDTTTPGMLTAVPASIFGNVNLRVRIWFSDGQVAPAVIADHAITSVGYAFFAQSVADGSITSGKLAPGAVNSTALANDVTFSNLRLDSSGTETVTLNASTAAGQGALFTLRNGVGATTFSIDSDSATRGGEVAFFDANGLDTIRLQAATEFGAGALIELKNGFNRTTLIADGDASGRAGSLALYDTPAGETQKLTVLLQGDEANDSGGIVKVYDSTGTKRAELDGQGASGGGELVLQGAGNFATVNLRGAEGATTGARLEMRQANGALTAVLDGEGSTGGGFFELYKADGTRSVWADADTGGEGKISTQTLATRTLEIATGGSITLLDTSGTTTVSLLSAQTNTTGARLEMFQSNGARTVVLDAEGGTGGGFMEFYKSNGTRSVWIDADSAGDGRISTQVLEITGGSDFSENFEIRSGDAQPGMLVKIDPAHPGELALSDRPYDRTVAGVVSGAGGVKPGLMMGQRGTVADGKHPVALTGRVYCLVDADRGAIEPGDLITTSDVPGYGMKVDDHTRGHGAIVGKAMTGLASGRGLVLVLVSLQ
jgi:hypothetical protein